MRDAFRPGLLRGAAVAASVLMVSTLAWSQQRDPGPEDSADPLPLSMLRLDPSSASSVSVIEREQIQSLGVQSLTELLQVVPGMHVDEPGGRGGVASAYIRGGEANYTSVLVDGVRVNDPTNSRGGSVDLSLLGTHDIERIEVGRGVVPVAWGASSMAGAVNILTRRGGPQRRTRADFSIGRDGYHRELVQSSGSLGSLDYALGYALLDEGEPVDGSQFSSQTASVALGYELTERLRIRASVRGGNVDREAYTDASGGPEFSPTEAIETRDTDFTLASVQLAHDVSDRWGYELEWAFFDQREDLATPFVLNPANPFASLPPSESDTDFTRNEFRARSRIGLTRWAKLLLGGELLYEDGSSRGQLELFGFGLPTNFSLDRDVITPFAELELEPLPGLMLRAGVRQEMTRGEDDETLPRLGLRYELAATGTTFRTSWGRGRKLPSFFALADPVVGNSRLESERSESFEIGATQELWRGRASIDATWFYAKYERLIDFDFSTLSLVNRSDVDAQGFELSAAVQPFATFAVSGHATYVNTDIQHSSDELRNRPEWRGGLMLRWKPMPRFDATLNTIAVGTRLDQSLPTGEVKLDSWVRVDLALGWQLHEHVRVHLAIRNLFDADYEDFVGFPAQGTAARFGVEFSL